MNVLYQLLVYIHVVSVIVSIGPFFILLNIAGRLRSAGPDETEAFLGIFRFAVRLTKHAGHVLVGTGVLLIYLGPWSWQTPWIAMTLFIMFASIFFLASAFSPKLKKFSDPYQDKNKLISKLTRSTWIYIALLVAMLWFMVVKPGLW
ncbi:DUF2269 family protein [Mesobacillus zeae]|uniref:DUF2269 family protein n=1 Tax=Mesobacillus zeae TaxID=1917180 RepID=A0A398AX61_9BACI|nr:DUF2269 family protein [Mesobacillus zeae]RID82242.1 DUF2269 family protein [Mesobacillus zeae]